jgi:hypothetical protein
MQHASDGNWMAFTRYWELDKLLKHCYILSIPCIMLLGMQTHISSFGLPYIRYNLPILLACKYIKMCFRYLDDRDDNFYNVVIVKHIVSVP